MPPCQVRHDVRLTIEGRNIGGRVGWGRYAIFVCVWAEAGCRRYGFSQQGTPESLRPVHVLAETGAFPQRWMFPGSMWLQCKLGGHTRRSDNSARV